MRVLVTGGGGIIGSALIAELRKQEHTPYCIDNDITYDVTEAEKAWCLNINDTPQILYRLHELKPDAVVHLAEINSIDPLLQVDAFHTNVAATSGVLFGCAKFKIRCVVGTWGALSPSTPIIASLEYRRQLVELYSKGIVVFNEVRIPNIIHPELPASNFRAIVNRVYNYVDLSQPFILEQYEDSSYILDFNTPEYVAKEIIYCIGKRSRYPYDIGNTSYSDRISIHRIIELALDIFGCASMDIFGRYDPITLQASSPSTEQEFTIHNMIKKEWHAYL